VAEMFEESAKLKNDVIFDLPVPTTVLAFAPHAKSLWKSKDTQSSSQAIQSNWNWQGSTS
jgi:hypothetical protein